MVCVSPNQDSEVDLLRQSSFLDRIRYEQNFLYARGHFPFYSVLTHSRYRYALGNLLEKFAPENLFPVCVPVLNDPMMRRHFVSRALGLDVDTGPIERKLVLEDLDIGEPKPDFSLPDFDGLRSCFAYDLQQFKLLFSRYGVTTEFMDFDYMRVNVV